MEQNDRFIFGTDFHGNLKNVDHFLMQAAEHKVGHVIFGGDIAPKKMGVVFNDNTGYPLTALSSQDIQTQSAQTKHELYESGHIPFPYGITSAKDATVLATMIQKINTASEQRQDLTTYIDLTDIESFRRNIEIFNTYYSTGKGQRTFDSFRRKFADHYKQTDLSPAQFAEIILLYLEKSLAYKNRNPEFLKMIRQYCRGGNTPHDQLLSLLDKCETLGLDFALRGLIIAPPWKDLTLINEQFDRYSGPGQLQFIQDLIRKLNELKLSIKTQISIILGNDDLPQATDELRRAEAQGILIDATNKVTTLNDGVQMMGYSHVPPLPFSYTEWFKPEEEIEKDLKRLSKKVKKGATLILNIHCPPSDTDISKARIGGMNGEEFGSTAVRTVIKKMSPTVSLHGHLHLPYKITGKVQDFVDTTPVYNPGASEYTSRFIVSSLDNPKEYTLIT